MAPHAYTVFLTLVFGLLSAVVEADLVCRDVADAVFEFCPQSCKHTANRVAALEEQVRQLQKLVSTGSGQDVRRKYPGLATECEEIFANGTTQSGVYMISPDGRCPFSVYCDMTDDGWTVIQRRIDGAVSFYRTWDEYVQGFGDINGEYWLGLEKIHRHTKEGAEIYFDIENYDGTRDYAHYKSFSVHGATTLYKMNVVKFGYDGSLDELLSYHDNQVFSTFDRDNDKGGGNCAQILDGGGWWYNSCYRLGNPNGVFGKKTQGGIGYWTSKAVQVKTFTIKTKQREGACNRVLLEP